MKHAFWTGLFLIGMVATAHAAIPGDEAKGLWLSGDKAAIIEFKECSDVAGALCGTIVWDKDAGTPADACGTTIAKLKRYDGEAWREGWAFDPRTKKYYKATVRTEKSSLLLRAFVGVELLGETEEMTRASSIPAGCKPR
ncbi:DUF2147 domain-containing protein [Aquabacterium sp.]|uniref:DUF2147 domain-containing protein n=1 Tax=Aquabacterium sp. TaxID=1872578 RepID=UPI0035AFACEE